MASSLTARRVFVALIIASLFLLYLVVRPFAEALFLAAVFAAVLFPLQRRLTRRLRGREGLAASLLVLAVILAVLAPLGSMTAILVKEIADGARYVNQTIRSEGATGLINDLPGPLQNLVRKGIERLPQGEEGLDETLKGQVTSQGTKAAAAVGGVLSTTGSLLVQTVMMLIALYFLLTDGARLVGWLEGVSPLEGGQTLEILREFRSVSSAVLISTIATSGVQAAAAFVGFLIARSPQPVFFALVTFIVAFIPAVGAGGAVLVVAALQLATGHKWSALFLAIWGLLAVGLVDNVVKPLLVRRGLHLHGAIVFFALLGGLAAFGAIGLLLGPLIVAFFLALVRIHERDYGRKGGRPVTRTPEGEVVTSSEPTPPTSKPAEVELPGLPDGPVKG